MVGVYVGVGVACGVALIIAGVAGGLLYRSKKRVGYSQINGDSSVMKEKGSLF